MNVAPPLASSVVCAGILRGRPGDLESLAMIPSILPAKLSEATPPIAPFTALSKTPRVSPEPAVSPAGVSREVNLDEYGSSAESRTTQQGQHPFDGHHQVMPGVSAGRLFAISELIRWGANKLRSLRDPEKSAGPSETASEQAVA